MCIAAAGVKATSSASTRCASQIHLELGKQTRGSPPERLQYCVVLANCGNVGRPQDWGQHALYVLSSTSIFAAADCNQPVVLSITPRWSTRPASGCPRRTHPCSILQHMCMLPLKAPSLLVSKACLNLNLSYAHTHGTDCVCIRRCPACSLSRPRRLPGRGLPDNPPATA